MPTNAPSTIAMQAVFDTSELGHLIFDNLTFFDLLRASCVNSRWQALIHSSKNLQQKLFLSPASTDDPELWIMDERIVLANVNGPVGPLLPRDGSERSPYVCWSALTEHERQVFVARHVRTQLWERRFVEAELVVPVRMNSLLISGGVHADPGFHGWYATLRGDLKVDEDGEIIGNWGDMLFTQPPLAKEIVMFWTEDCAKCGGGSCRYKSVRGMDFWYITGDGKETLGEMLEWFVQSGAGAGWAHHLLDIRFVIVPTDEERRQIRENTAAVKRESAAAGGTRV